MELVYLWVEEYKNIRKQGFNFSPRFRWSYDAEEKELTIDENPIYDNSIIESIRPFVDNELFLTVYHDNQYKKISMYDFINKLVHKFPDTKDIIVGTTKDMPICKLETYKELNQSELDFFSVHFNYILDTLYDGVQDKWVKEIYHKADSYDTPLLIMPGAFICRT
jgi:hypothetical protein